MELEIVFKINLQFFGHSEFFGRFSPFRFSPTFGKINSRTIDGYINGSVLKKTLVNIIRVNATDL